MRGLTQSDFQIFEDGQLQTVTAFSAVDIPLIPVNAKVPDAPLAASDAVASDEPVGENSSYYLLGYYSTNTLADGKVRRNEIKVSRAGVRAVHRASYLAPPPENLTLKPR